MLLPIAIPKSLWFHWEGCSFCLRQCAIAINSKVSIKDEHKSSWRHQIKKNWIKRKFSQSIFGNFFGSKQIFGKIEMVRFYQWDQPLFFFSVRHTMILFLLRGGAGNFFNVYVQHSNVWAKSTENNSRRWEWI